jgi:uridine phosphorylase
MTVLIAALAMLLVFAVPAAEAVSVGVYSATFDPPTKARLRIIHCALGDPGLASDCKELSEKISRLYVLVREDPEVDTLASARERTLMVKRALSEYGERVQVLAANSREAEAKTRSLLADDAIERLYEFVNADTYNQIRSAPVRGAPKRVTVAFPLESDGGAAAPAGAWAQLVDDAVREVIDRLGLYRPVSADLIDLQKALFQEGWKDFLDDLALACPVTISANRCAELSSGWKTISIVTDDPSAKPSEHKSPTESSLIYKIAQSEDRWAEKFVNTALGPLDGAEGYDKLKEAALDFAARTLEGYPRGRVPHLRTIAISGSRAPRGAPKVSRMPVSCSAPAGAYNMDIDQYTADRFPRAFGKFLTQDYRNHSRLPIELYVHNNAIEQAYEFHRRDGFETFYFLQTRRGQLHRDIHLAVKSNPRAYRVVLTSVRGNDRRANVLCQVRGAAVFSTYRFVQAPREEPLFVLNAEGDALKLDHNDWLLFGFRGSWRRSLQADNWRMTSLIREGLDIDVFTHPATKQKLVTARNVYGDDVNIILDTFYKKGARRMIYLGSAGAIQDYQIGDLVIPSEFVDRKLNSVSFGANLGLAYEAELAKILPVHGRTRQAWAQHLYEETVPVLMSWKNHSVGAVDIEGIYLGRFAEKHKDLKIAALFVISDQTLGETTIEESNAYRGVIDESVDKIVSFLLPKVTGARLPTG